VTHGLFEVTGRREYRGHVTGTRFEARMDVALQRAINRGDIRLIAEVEPSLEPGSYQLPTDWPPIAADAPAHTEGRREAPLLVEGGGK